MIAIETKNLTKKYDDNIAVNKLNLKIKNGEIFSLLGINGAGKTTTIKMLSCINKPTSGDAIILGNSINDNTIKIKQLINVSPQETAVARNLSVEENLVTISKLYGFDTATSNKKAEKMIEEFDLHKFRKTKAKKLSGGWQRRLSIAMALITEPKIVFLDEPTLGLDVIARKELWKLLEQLKGKTTVILTTHYLEEAEALSDRIAIMSNGNLKAVGTVNELLNITHKTKFEDAFIELCTKRGDE